MASTEAAQVQPQARVSRVLKVDFRWKKWTATVSERDDPENKPIYIIKYKNRKPNIIFKKAADDSTFGTGTLHAVHIDADCEVNGKHILIKALKRWQTEYQHLSYAFSKTDKPIPMNWTSEGHFKTWDFICHNEELQKPVARFAANAWSTTKVGNIEILEDTSEAVVEEIVVTGLTLFYCMALRASSIVSFFGAMFAKPGPIKQDGNEDEIPGASDSSGDESFDKKTLPVSTGPVKS